MGNHEEKFNIQKASDWASKEYERNITPSNISYLIQYGQIRKIDDNGETKVYKDDLKKYYSKKFAVEIVWKEELGEDLNWRLSFDDIKEKDRTKHVHRLHPYKGKFIPQLVEYFLDDHTDDFKKDKYFEEGDIILDPFCGSGTTLVQANELGMHAVGIDISEFNALISNVKISNPNTLLLQQKINEITIELENFVKEKKYKDFVDELSDSMHSFNDDYFPAHDYIYDIRHGEIDEETYSEQKEKEFLDIYGEIVDKYDIQVIQKSENNSFLDKWYLDPARKEIDFIIDYVENIEHEEIRNIIKVILSRTIRSCRATTHADLATLKDPVTAPYYCRKHYKICKPRFSIVYWWKRYSKDTINRLSKFADLRTDAKQYCLTGDARNINIINKLQEKHSELAELLKEKSFKGIFTSPPYLGMIDYHEQHAYAYDLFVFRRRDHSEIGSLSDGKGEKAREDYVQGISEVLLNSKRFLTNDYDVFVVANDERGLYPKIAERANMKIVNRFRRPVLNRTEKDKSPYGETIFHMKER